MSKIMGKILGSKISDVLLDLVLVGITIYFVLMTVWAIVPIKILEPLDGNYTLDKTEYHHGETLKIRFHICKRFDIPEDVYGRFVDGVIFSVPENSSSFDKGCYDTFITGTTIPDTLPAGKYSYIETVIYDVFGKEIRYTFETPEFTVVDDEECN